MNTASTRHILVTGGAGFIGSNFIRLLFEHRPSWQVTNLDLLTYAGNLDNLADVKDHPGYRFVRGDICDAVTVGPLMDAADMVVHFAAESHVDRSIEDSIPFIRTNVQGTQTLLDEARRAGVERFLHVSTDEVYGQLPLDRPDLKFTEATPISPSSPYAASKAASDLLVAAAYHTFGLPCLTTRCSNNFGPYQFPEKVIPLFVERLLTGGRVPLYGDGKNVRDWLHVLDHAEAILTVLEKGTPGEAYNIGGNNERNNLELTHTLIGICGRDESAIEYVPDRLGHDLRYAIDASKIKRELGWEPKRSAWPEALQATVDWYREHAQWRDRITSGAYREGLPKRVTV
ncbi:MAG: dTDP-glucose 4,6-dehydratase [Phycisphaerales bacterium]|nr:dTDP-glucose 4,6-dehydratase [Phycisphaerales bacterium]